ncbi:MAG: hypothetical protein R3F62_15185 [Planctomycetota bacterium]
MRHAHRTLRRGSTLILVLIVATLLSWIAFSTADLARHASEQAFVERERALALYRAEAAAEALRLQVIRHFEVSQLSPRRWLQAVQQDRDYRVFGVPPNGVAAPVDWESVGPVPLPPPPGSAAVGVAVYPSLPGVRAWIDQVSYDQGWIELVAGTTPEVGATAADARAPLSVHLRLSLYRNAIFDLAMITETVNCMFCHLDVRGDVGSIGFLRPGLGSENGRGRLTGASSRIWGNVYVGDRASDDSDFNWGDDVLRDPRLINGTQVDGSVLEHYRGPYLPEDTIGHDGVPDFPSFDPAQIRRRAVSGQGSIGVAGGRLGGPCDGTEPGMWIVPRGENWDSGGGPGSGARTEPPAATSVIEGNLVLLGSEDDSQPIEIAGNVYVEGDVILRGSVRGRGALYAARNVYVIGDLRYADAPTIGFPIGHDEAALRALADPAGELRIAARGSVVIGDWTYLDDHGEVRRVAERQAQDYMYAQFDLGRVRFYLATNDGSLVSVELRQDPSTGGFVDDLGRPVSPERIARVDASWIRGRVSPFDAARYDAALAPGNLTRTGAPDGIGGAYFDPWLDQEHFRQLLGTKLYDLITVRVPGTEVVADRIHELGPLWVAEHGPHLPGSLEPGKTRLFDGDLLHEGAVGLLLCGGQNDQRWRAAYIAKDRESKFPWTTQVEHIDAYLFATRRIAGKSDRGCLTVNGGMAAAEIGVLAPGYYNVFIKNEQLVEGSDRVPRWVFASFRPSSYDHPKNAYGHLANKSRIYYDYRLRNGGFGFDFLAKLGDVLHYSRGGRAAPPRGADLEGLNLFPRE